MKLTMSGVSSFLRTTLASGVVAAVVSSGISLYGTYKFQIAAEKNSQDRATLLAQIGEFSTTNDALIPIIGQYIKAVNSQQGLDSAQEALRTRLAQEILKANELQNSFGSGVRPVVNDYQDALALFQKSITEAKDPTHMYTWTRYFDQVIRAKSTLVEALYGEIGVRPDRNGSATS